MGAALRHERKYTVEEWMSWDEDVRCELIDGELFLMPPPALRHQGIVGEIYVQLHQQTKGGAYRTYMSPVGVRLNEGETALEPDIIIVGDKAKLAGGKICEGAPDMVVEVLSPSTSSKDKVLKFNKYLRAGVREYWIVDPNDNTVNVNIWVNGTYQNKFYGETDVVPVHILDGCTINLNDVFTEDWNE
jgi:Uma2 family endonuclease